MSSPITFSGFNNVDFSSIISVLVQQQRAPILLAQEQQNNIELKLDSLGTLKSRIDAIKSKAQTVNSSLLFLATTATSSDTSVFTASAGDGAAVGSYSVKVSFLAKAQSTVSTSTYGSPDDVVATGGSIVVDGQTISITESTTIQQLATKINETAGIGVTANVIDTGGGAYKLVVSGKDTGLTNAFTISGNALTGGSGVAFTDTDTDGIYGDSQADNVVNARDAELTINGLTITRASNTVDDAISGVTLNLLTEDAATTHTLTVARDTSSIVSAVQDFVTTYNDFASYVNAEYTIGETTEQPGPLAGEAVLRTTRSGVTSDLRSAVSVGGAYSYLAEVGITFDRSGNLELDSSTLTDALSSNEADVQSLFQGTESADGVFDKLVSTINSLTATDGILYTTEANFNDSIDTLSDRISTLESQAEIYRQALVQQFAAVDQLMSQLNSFTTTLQGLQST